MPIRPSASCENRYYSSLDSQISTPEPCPSPAEGEAAETGATRDGEASLDLCPSDPSSAYALKLYAQEAAKKLTVEKAPPKEESPAAAPAEESHSTAGAIAEGVYAFFGILNIIYNILD